MGKGVVVVILERRECEQGGAVLGHGLCEPVDHRTRRARVRLAFVLRRFPELTGDRHRIGVQLLDGGHVGKVALDLLLDDDAADADVFQIGQIGQVAVPPFDGRDCLDEARHLVCGHAAVEGDPLDAALLQPPGERPHRLAFCNRHVVDDDLIADEADDDRWRESVQQLNGRGQRLEVPTDDRMAFRIQLRRAQRRSEPAQELVRELEARGGHASLPRACRRRGRPRSRRGFTAFLTPRRRDAAASSRT